MIERWLSRLDLLKSVLDFAFSNMRISALIPRLSKVLYGLVTGFSVGTERPLNDGSLTKPSSLAYD